MSIISGTKSDGTHTTVLVGSDGALATSLATQIAGEDLDRGLMKVVEECHATSLTASGQVMGGPGRFYGFIITTGAGGSDTVKFWDNTSAAGIALVDTLVVTAPMMYVFPVAVRCDTGLYYTEGGTVVVTILYEPDAS
jgi:hypothetical protein